MSYFNVDKISEYTSIPGWVLAEKFGITPLPQLSPSFTEKLDCATTFKEAWEVYRVSSERERFVALQKALEFVTTSGEAWDVYFATPSGSVIHREALQRLEALRQSRLDLITTTEEALEMYKANAPCGGTVKMAALQKALDLAITLKEVWRVYLVAPDGSAVWTAAVYKIADFFRLDDA